MSASHMTEQGRATRQRIVAAAATLIGEGGVAGTTLDDVRAATSASKSQLYHYFGDKHGLVEAVIDYQSVAVLGAQARALGAVRNWNDLERWAEGLVAMVDERGGRGGCPLGTLAAALADTDERFRIALSDAFQSWRDAIGGALRRLRDNGLLAPDADLEALTTMTLAAVQGGLLLAKTSRDSSQLRAALAGAIAQVRVQGGS
ncbi:MAG TPA: TetR/AcrR family transcriptional regulator [Solirubrobacteraceae bacterium]|nr:TetR/AcrR family transcriptional regulator [Solirubrobacteraceae bacterium]